LIGAGVVSLQRTSPPCIILLNLYWTQMTLMLHMTPFPF
jgi:hypothetical protein